ncbi:MAG: hypothetical protein J1F23_03940 [Oscillospiraceae bacterium]|nr:hypothetical protein [Oscillospiraceae bacterium]
MLQSKFSKKKERFKAQRIFTDRVEPRAVFLNSVQKMDVIPQEIVVYYGKGGIGKSRLLKGLLFESSEVYSSVKPYVFHNIFISLDAYDYANPVNILMAIRNGIHGDCGLFDYALLQYCAKAKMTVDEILSKNQMLSSPIVDVLNEIISLGTASACIPTAALNKCISLIKDLRFRTKYKEEIAELINLNEFEIFERLPYYLGLCISYAATKGHIHVLFLDSYESLLARTERGTPSVEREEWLRELFLSSDILRIVIASRDRLRWDKEDREWNDYLNQHLLDNLSIEDCRWFLNQVPITDTEIVETIAQRAGGVPLYLDMCVDIYESSINDGENFDLNSLKKGEKVIDRYIRHLSDKDKCAIKILSIPKCFNEAFAMELLKRQSLIYSVEQLQILFEKSIFLPVEGQKSLWKVDESVRLHLKDHMEQNRKNSILESILDYIIQQPAGGNYPYLVAVLDAIYTEPKCMESIQEKCVQAVECYANMGFWNEIHSILNPTFFNHNTPIQALAVFAELIRLRRIGQLQQAEILIEQYPLKQEYLGVWFYMYRYLKIQVRHLLGHYDECIQAYKDLTDEMALIRTTIPDHIYNTVFMKYSDLLFLKGEFEEALSIVEQLLCSDKLTLYDQIELFRIKGHIYRFQKQYSEAQIIYRSALHIAEEHELRAYMGKLFTNMTEATCIVDPGQALEWFNKAKQQNEDSNNDIELGKALAAASAAYTTLGDTRQGITLAKQAILIVEKTGYQSGRAFGLAALQYALDRAGYENDAKQIKQELERQIQTIGVYKYILEGKK